MKLFQNLFKPKWKNSDPEIRKQALIHLDKESHQDVFMQIATHDPSPELRLLALKRLIDLAAVNKIALADSDNKINELGNKILCQMLSGEAEGSLNNEQRQEKVSQLDNLKVVEYIAQKGVTPALRLTAIKKVNRESLLGNLAINDNDAEIRKTAISQITQKSTLERIFKATKTKDKVVSRIAKEKLDEITRQEELPIKRLNDQKTLCSKMEALGTKGLWERDKIQFDNLSSQWQELSEGQTLELLNRFEDAKNQFNKNYQNYLKRYEEQLKQEAALLPIKKEKQNIISELSSLLASFGENPNFNDEEINSHKEIIREKERLWHSIQQLPSELETELTTQFNDISRSIKTIIKTAESEKSQLSELITLEKNVDRALSSIARITESNIQNSQKQLTTLSIGHLSTDALNAKNRISNKINKAINKLEEKEQSISKLIDEVKDKLPKLNEALEQGILKDAISIKRNVQGVLKKLEKLNVKGLQKYKNHLSIASAKIDELNNWKSWANTPQKEALIAKVETLIDSNDDPKEIAFIVSQSRKEWKNLGASEKETSQELWEKFQEVCDKAYEPCKAYFEKESEIREKNYQSRVEFLENFEQFIKITNWETIDWKKVEQLHRQAKGEWQSLGQTDHEKRKELNKRFYTAYNTLRDKLKEEWARNFDAKQDLINAANELTSIEDLRTAISKAKELQTSWKNAGRIEPKKERELWTIFKQACDKVFTRRHEEQEKKEQQAAETINNKEMLCQQIEQLAQKSVEEIDEVKSSFQKLKAEFQSISTNVKDKEKELKKRVNDAIDIFERKLESVGKLEKLSILKALKESAMLCETAELAIEQNKAKEEVDAIIAKLSQAEQISESDWQKKLEHRINQLNQLLLNNSTDILEQNYENLKMTTTQLEVLADIETPQDSAEDRLKIQAQRLSKKLQNHEEKGTWEEFLETEANWLCTGPVSNERLSVLKKRREKAIAALKHDYPTELNDYI